MKYILSQGGTIEFFSPSSGNVVTIKEDGKVYINGIGGYDGTNPESASTIQEESVFEKGTGANSAQLKGTGAVASGDGSHAEGESTTAIGVDSHAEGSGTTASGSCSHAEGRTTIASGNYSHAEGVSSRASGANSHAEGSGGGTQSTFTVDGAANATTYTTNQAHNLGVGQVIEYDDTYSRVESVPDSTSFTVNHTLSSAALSAARINIITGIAYGNYSHAEGKGTTASGNYSHAEGNNTIASGDCSHVEGGGTKAGGNYSHAEGNSTTASGNYSHAEGNGTAASGVSSHAEGYYTTAGGDYSHTEGYNTTANRAGSHAEGGGTTASGNYSHAEGGGTTASGDYSHAEGGYTTAYVRYSHAEGTYNFPDTGFIHMVGIGSAENKRFNAHTITTGGLHYILGVGGYTGQGTSGAMDLATVISSFSSFESLSEMDYNMIYGKISVSDIGIIAFDDYPENIVQEVLDEYGCQTLSELASYAKDDPGCTGENWLTNTGNYLEYDGETYELWRGHAGPEDTSNYVILGLLPIGTTYAQLSSLSIEVDESSEYCPFVALCFNTSGSTDWGDGQIYEQDGTAFSLLYVTQKQ